MDITPGGPTSYDPRKAWCRSPDPVVAGRYEVVNRRGAEVGRFVYAKSYIARGVSLLAAF